MISQREARRLQIQVRNLNRQILIERQSWRSDWEHDWVNIATTTEGSAIMAAIKTARKLGHAVIVLPDGETTLRFYADKL